VVNTSYHANGKAVGQQLASGAASFAFEVGYDTWGATNGADIMAINQRSTRRPTTSRRCRSEPRRIVGIRWHGDERVSVTGSQVSCNRRVYAWDLSPSGFESDEFGRVRCAGGWYFAPTDEHDGVGRLDRFDHALDRCPRESWSFDRGSTYARWPNCLRSVIPNPEGSPMTLRIYEDGVAAYGWPVRTRHLIPYDPDRPVVRETTAAPRRLEEPVCEP